MTAIAHRHRWYQLNRISDVLQRVIAETFTTGVARHSGLNRYRFRLTEWQNLLWHATPSDDSPGVGADLLVVLGLHHHMPWILDTGEVQHMKAKRRCHRWLPESDSFCQVDCVGLRGSAGRQDVSGLHPLYRKTPAVTSV